jgi:hypothetical protein
MVDAGNLLALRLQVKNAQISIIFHEILHEVHLVPFQSVKARRAGRHQTCVLQEKHSICSVTDPAPTRRLAAGCRRRREVHLVHADGANVVRFDTDAGDVNQEELVVAVKQPGLPETHPFGEINLACVEIVE